MSIDFFMCICYNIYVIRKDMITMSRPKHFYLQLDTETCGDLDNPFVYDLGMAIKEGGN